MSESRQPEMNHSKRKSLGGSPDPEKDEHVDAPNKRLKVDDSPDPESGPEKTPKHPGSTANEKGGQRQVDVPGESMVVDGETSSPDAQRPTGAAVDSPPPRQARRMSESRRRDFSPHSRSPNQDRRTYDSRTRGVSPRTREWQRSETARRGSDPKEGFGHNDRNRRPVFSKEEERKRGKRLFGGLLSTLSQTTNNSQQKRRQEIEKRQQEKAAKQKIEDDLRRNERLAKLDAVRKVEQVRFDEQVVST